MAVRHYVDEVAPSGGRVYAITDASGSEYKHITDMTEYVTEGTAWGAGDVQDNCLLECNHSKTGTVHALTTENTLSVNIRFTATAAWESGDALTFNGTSMSCKLKNGESLPNGAWESGAVVTCYKAGNTLYFDLPNTIGSSTQTVNIGGDSNKVLKCFKQGSIVVLELRLTNVQFSSGRSQLGGTGVIPSAFRPSNLMLSPLCRPVNTQNTSMASVSSFVFEIDASGNIYVFTNDTLGAGWVLNAEFIFTN